MKIGPNTNNLINFYETTAKRAVAGRNTLQDKSVNNSSPVKDKIEISEKGLRHGEVVAAKRNLIESLEKSASEKRIQELREKINSGQYFVSSRDIAEAILKLKK
ncbi:MAG TPA: flagellar biosynthesis anti-sigma factor FlgM [Candidatus Avimonas sp.]|nr:flagellar biosynthesis anti-sigma factor FlgM [Clostridiales bacterium]HPU58658.1 flagellar biosynthesis anti-sigma factor FlgM [Candidatus Avimonas sp.]